MILIIDQGIGNAGSIANMLKRIGFESICSANQDDVINANKIILPGVGSFDHAVNRLRKKGLLELIKNKVVYENTPILGICLGMQMLCKKSEEGSLPGLGLIDGEVVKFENKINNLKIPHMGWNTVKVVRHSKLFNDMPENFRFYFVHSYYVSSNNSQDTLATTKYGHQFISAIQKDNIIGVQFHPEKSHKFGMQLLKNFVEEF